MYRWRTSLLASLLALAVLVLSVPDGRGQDKNKVKSINFKTFDGVTIQGALYPNQNGKRDAVVMLLHDFSAKGGGNSTKGNLPELAKMLQADGYAVLTFDFRGFGESKEVNDTFWTVPATLRHFKVKAKLGESIEHKTFPPGYYINLINDIAAAKAYLDRLSDRGEVNSHNTIVIGCGQAAALGSLWVAGEGRRKKDMRPKGSFGGPIYTDLSPEPESKDVAACIWLSMTTSVEGRAFRESQRVLLQEVAKNEKVPMVFYYGKNDSSGDNISNSLIKNMKTANKEVQVIPYAVDGSSATGGALLDSPTRKQIIKHLDKVMDARGTRENKKHDSEGSAYYYLLPRDVKLKVFKTAIPRIQKKPGDEVGPVDLDYLLNK